MREDYINKIVELLNKSDLIVLKAIYSVLKELNGIENGK